MPRKLTYRITYKEHIVEGRASSAQNACRLAFKKLIEAKLIKNTPKSDINTPSTFADTKVEIIDD